MAEIIRFKSCRVWRAPLLKAPQQCARPQKRLRIQHPHYGECEAVFEKQCEVWIVVKTGERFHWLKNKLAADVKIMLEADGATWEWINEA